MVRPTDSKFCARKAAAISITLSIGLLAATTPAYAAEAGLEGPSVFDNVVAQEVAAEDGDASFAAAIAEALGSDQNTVIAIPTDDVDENGEELMKIVAIGDDEFQATVDEVIAAESEAPAEEAAPVAEAAVEAPEATAAIEPVAEEAEEAEAIEAPAGEDDAALVDAPTVTAMPMATVAPEANTPEYRLSTMKADTVSVSTYEQLQDAITNQAGPNMHIVLMNTININAPLLIDAGKTVILDLQSEFAIVPVDASSFSSFFKVVGESAGKTVIQVLSGSIASPVVECVVETNHQNVELLFGGDILYAKRLFDNSENWKCNLVGEGVFTNTVVVGEGSDLVINEGGFSSRAKDCAIRISGGQMEVSKGFIEADKASDGDAAIIVENGGSLHIYSGSFSSSHGSMLYSTADSSIQIDSGTFAIGEGSILNPNSKGALTLNLDALDAATVAALLPDNYQLEDGKIVYHEPIIEPDPDPEPEPEPDPTPVDPTPADPTPADPTPVEPTPAVPTPSVPASSDPEPAGPVAPSGGTSHGDYYFDDDAPSYQPIRAASNAAPAIETLGAALQSPETPLPFTGFYTNSMLDTNDALATRDANEEDSATIAATTFSKNGAQGAGDGNGKDGSVFDGSPDVEIAAYPMDGGFSVDPAPTAAVATGIAAAVLIGVRVSQFSAVNAAAAAQGASGSEPKKPKKKKAKSKKK